MVFVDEAKCKNLQISIYHQAAIVGQNCLLSLITCFATVGLSNIQMDIIFIVNYFSSWLCKICLILLLVSLFLHQQCNFFYLKNTLKIMLQTF